MSPEKIYVTLGVKSSLEFSWHTNQKDFAVVRVLKSCVALFKGLLGEYKVNALSNTVISLVKAHRNASYVPIIEVALNKRGIQLWSPQSHLTTTSLESSASHDTISEPEREFSPDFLSAIEELNQYDGIDPPPYDMKKEFRAIEHEIKKGKLKKNHRNILNKYFDMFVNLIHQKNVREKKRLMQAATAERLMLLGFTPSNKKTKKTVKELITESKKSELFLAIKTSYYLRSGSQNYSLILKDLNNIPDVFKYQKFETTVDIAAERHDLVTEAKTYLMQQYLNFDIFNYGKQELEPGSELEKLQRLNLMCCICDFISYRFYADPEHFNNALRNLFDHMKNKNISKKSMNNSELLLGKVLEIKDKALIELPEDHTHNFYKFMREITYKDDHLDSHLRTLKKLKEHGFNIFDKAYAKDPAKELTHPLFSNFFKAIINNKYSYAEKLINIGFRISNKQRKIIEKIYESRTGNTTTSQQRLLQILDLATNKIKQLG